MHSLILVRARGMTAIVHQRCALALAQVLRGLRVLARFAYHLLTGPF